MISFSTYKAILWDFDGVLIDSLATRDRGFALTLSDYPKKEVEALLDYHRSNGGLSRYVKFRYFFEKIRNERATNEMIMDLASRFSILMLAELSNPELLIEDTIRFVRENYRHYEMHIVSGSDEKELRALCGQLQISDYFKSIWGSPKPKTELVQLVMHSNNYNTSEVVLIGDSMNDRDAAIYNAIDFIGYNCQKLKNLDVKYVDQFFLL